MKKIEAFFAYLQIYASMFTAIILTFFLGLLTYKVFAVILAGFAVIFIIYNFFKARRGHTKVIVSTIIGLVLFLLYILTSKIYHHENKLYASYFLVVLGQTLPAMIFASQSAQISQIQIYVKKLAPFIGILFTLIAFSASFFANAKTSGGLSATESGLNYQSISYLAAYGAGLNYTFILCHKKLKFKSYLSKFLLKVPIFYGLIIINLLSIFIAGGRGALVLFAFLTLFFIYWNLKQDKNFQKTLVKIIFGGSAVILILIICIAYARSSDISTNGFKRIERTINTGDQNGRDILREKALQSFSSAPLLGHGVGSVFYENGYYSHNIITDILVESGVFGLVILLLLLYGSWRKGMNMCKNDVTNTIWLIFYLDGFGMSLFSGYYIGMFPLIWSMVFLFCYPKNRKLRSNAYHHTIHSALR